jgi:hypothetical protein
MIPTSIGSLLAIALFSLSVLLGGAGCTQNSYGVPESKPAEKQCYGPDNLPVVRDANGKCVFVVPPPVGPNPTTTPPNPVPTIPGGGPGTPTATPAPTPTLAPPAPSCPALGCHQEGVETVCNMPVGGTLDVVAAASYPPGFPSGLPAMGLGAPNLGYIPVDWPFTCTASGLDRAVGMGNSGVGGKICEVNFDNTNTSAAMGRSSYRLKADPTLQPGPQLYQFGFTCNYGCSVLHPGFKVRIVCMD